MILPIGMQEMLTFKEDSIMIEFSCSKQQSLGQMMMTANKSFKKLMYFFVILEKDECSYRQLASYLCLGLRDYDLDLHRSQLLQFRRRFLIHLVPFGLILGRTHGRYKSKVVREEEKEVNSLEE
jgi:hypothetical protein